MKAVAPLQKTSGTAAALTTTGKTTQNPLQLKSASAQQNPLQLKKEHTTGLPDDLKAGVEDLSGYSMDDVNVHYNSDKPAQLQALAYAQGTDIHIAPGQEKHLPHEAWHVVQQKQGRVRPTVQMKGKGIGVNENQILEKEADKMGSLLFSGNSVNRQSTIGIQNKKGLIDNKQSSSLLQQKGNLGSAIQLRKGPIDKKDGLTKKEIITLCKESETTHFDMRGHSMSRHGGHVTEEDLMTRRRIPLDTHFDENSLLFLTVSAAIEENIGEINGWLKNKTAENLVLKVDMSGRMPDDTDSLGTGMMRIPGIGPGHKKRDDFTSATVILRKVLPDQISKSMNLAKNTEWHLLTAYPSD